MIDLSFGDSGIKESSSSFGFGSWGIGKLGTAAATAAATVTSSSWDFGAIGSTSTDVAESKSSKDSSRATNPTSAGSTDATSWSFGGNKKNKKKTTTSGFDFGGFDKVDNLLEEESNPSADYPKVGENTTNWGDFTTANKNEKKKKKNAIEEVSEPGIAVLPEISKTGGDDSWGGWVGSGQKNKKNNKANDVPPVPPIPPAAPVLQPPPAAPEEASADDGWGISWGAKKGKKKGDKVVPEEPKIEVVKVEEPDSSAAADVIVVPDPDAEVGWGFGTKKDKKRNQKAAVEEVKADKPTVEIVPDLVPAWDSGWATGTTKKGKKGPKNEAFTAALTEKKEVDGVEDALGAWDTTTKKKGSKKADESSTADASDKKDNDFIEDTIGGRGSTNKKKGAKNADGPTITKLPQQKNVVPDTSDIWGNTSKKDKKSKTPSFLTFEEEDTGPIEGEADVASPAAEDDWMEWGTTKSKAKKKGGAVTEDTVEDFPPPPPPPPPPVASNSFDASKEDTSLKKTKDKKNKKGKGLDPTPAPEFKPEHEPEPEIVVVPEIKVEVKNELLPEDWSHLSAKEGKRKEKEAAKRKAEEKIREEERMKEEERLIEEERIREEKTTREDERIEVEKRLEDEKQKKEADSKKKPGRKAVGAGASASKTKDLLAGSVPDTFSALDDDTWGGAWGSAKKSTKKGGLSNLMEFEVPPAAPTPPAMGLTPEPEENEPLQDDWGSFPAAKTKDKKYSKGASLTRTTSKASDPKESMTGLKGSTDKNIGLLSTLVFLDDTPEDKKEPPKEETPAKAARSFWGSIGGGTVNAKPKTKREEKAEAEAAAKEAAAKEDSEVDAEIDEIFGLVDSEPELEPEPVAPPLKSGSKSKTSGKMSRTNSKGSDKLSKADKNKGESETLVDIVEETPKEVRDGKDNSKGGDAKGISDVKADDGWNSFFGSAKKTPVKKGDEFRKEITKSDPTNQKAATKKGWNVPEEVEADGAEESKQPLKSSKMSATKASLTNSKAAGKPSVAEKVKALEKDKGISKAEATPPPPPPPPPAPEPQLKETKPKLTRTPTSSSKKKDLSPFIIKDEPKKSPRDSVPGSFPSEERDDDIVEIIEVPPPEKKTKGKAGKTKKVPEPEPELEPTMDDMIVEAPAPPPAPPTPPPEPVAPKSTKKERARVVRDDASPYWGFWGSTPKKDVRKAAGKSKDDNDVAPSTPKEKVLTAGLSRSKSTKTPREEEKEELSRSSASDKDKAVESPRPTPKSRNSGFSGFFGGPSPARAKPLRRSSTIAVPKSTSRRQSVDVGASGIPSPPLDDEPEISGKAAKLMGMGSGKLDRKASTRGKQKAKGMMEYFEFRHRTTRSNPILVIPDPYAIGDDDMVMVNPVEDPVINAPVPRKTSKDPRKEKLSRSKSTREPREQSPQRVYPPSGGVYLPDRTKPPKESSTGKSRKSKYEPEAAEDIVMVEAGPSSGSPEIITGPDDMAFVEKPREPPPPQLKRSATSAKKSEGLKGLFGFRKTRRASDSNDRPRTRTIYADEEMPSRRKRSAVDGGDGAKRPRRDHQSRRGGEKRDVDGEAGFVTDAAPNGGASTEAEEAGARREERRARRAEKESTAREARRAELSKLEEKQARNLLNDKAATEARKAKIREARDREARAREDKKDRQQDDNEARRTDEEERREAEDEVPGDPHPPPTPERRSKHRSSRGGDELLARHRSERRRSHMDKPTSSRTADEDAERRARREDRRSRRTPTEKPSSSGRKTAPVDDYFDSRNGSRSTPTAGDPYLHSGATDHTSTWVNSQIIEPPPPPPIEPTVIEPPPILGPDAADDDLEEIRRAKRKSSRRRSRYVDVLADETDERKRRRERREKEIRSSEGSENDRYARRRSDYGVRSPAGARSPDAGAGKRASWFKKITNL